MTYPAVRKAEATWVERLASYMALSARRMSSSGSSPGVEWATPTLTPTVWVMSLRHRTGSVNSVMIRSR